jgi:hypothetical protein
MAQTAVALVLSPAPGASFRPEPDRYPDPGHDPQLQLTLASDGVQCHVWESRYGPMLIEVKDGQIFVNGQRVERAEP